MLIIKLPCLVVDGLQLSWLVRFIMCQMRSDNYRAISSLYTGSIHTTLRFWQQLYICSGKKSIYGYTKRSLCVSVNIPITLVCLRLHLDKFITAFGLPCCIRFIIVLLFFKFCSFSFYSEKLCLCLLFGKERPRTSYFYYLSGFENALKAFSKPDKTDFRWFMLMKFRCNKLLEDEEDCNETWLKVDAFPSSESSILQKIS